ncbi:MAG: penicillin-binding protein 2 [Gammaproteobacteria bacterium]|nr:penicillin-binding protein 2 [Gammaproteobacteria bacterium]MBU1415663.1 penicillin-binding protein 2 [Gammaproteobacteria bacterium]
MKFARSPILVQRLSPGRSRFVVLILLASFVVLAGRSFHLQVLETDFLQKKGEDRYERVLEISATRGRILDRYGDVLAISTPVKAIWAIPEDARLSPAQSRQLAKLLEMNVREINRKLASEKDFVFLKRQIPPDVADKIAALGLPGIHDQREYRRYYPSGDATAHVLGFTGVDDTGQEGVELAMNDLLNGKPGSRRVIKDRRGEIVEDVESIHAPQEGRDVTLALDAKIQYLAYSQLRKAVFEHKAKAGGVVVLDVKTGEILALANMPTYNPNNRGRLVGAQLRNRAFTDTFEPGSTFKPFTAALALEKGRFHFNTPIDTSPGRLTIGSATIHDAHKHEVLTLAEVVQKSSNVGVAKVALTFAPKEMWQMFDDLGFGVPLKLGFPGEVGGRLRPAQTWRPIEQATMSYGHGISVTLMQLAHAYLTFARDGDLIPVSLTRVDVPPVTGTRVYSAPTAHEVRTMLEMAVQPGGTAPRAQVPGYRVAGKTGTARKLDGGRYTEKYVASFIGFAPASDPRLIVAVMVDEPSGKQYYGGEVAAPAFAEIMSGALRALGVPQDMPLRPLIVAEAVKEGV